MKCPRCNDELSDNLKYCKRCGQKLENNHDDQYYYSEFYSNIFKPTVTSDEDYIKAYIGQSYENVKQEKFSLAAFIMGPFYLLINKIYTPATLFLLLTIGIYSYDQDLSYMFYIIISAYIGLKGTSMYLQHATRKVEEIKIGNPDKSSTELLELCKKNGKNTHIIAIIIVTAIILMINTLSYKYIREMFTNSYNEKIEEENIVTTTYKTKDMSYELYPNFTTTAITNNYTSYQYKDENNNCHITIMVDKFEPIYKTIDDYINRNIYINDSYQSIDDLNQKLNGIDFKTKRIITNNNERLLLFTVYNNNIYYIEYSEVNNYNNKYCEQSIEKFTKTVFFAQ